MTTYVTRGLTVLPHSTLLLLERTISKYFPRIWESDYTPARRVFKAQFKYQML